MTDELNQVPTEAAVEAVPPEPEEQTFEFQPMDENDKPIGGKQVFKYRTPQELQEKLQKQNVELIKLNRKLTRDIRLGNLVQDEIPSDAPRVPVGQYEFAPAPMSAEERMAIVQDFADPENFDRAAKRLISGTIGDPDAIRGALSRAEQRLAAMSAKEEAESFVRSTPSYFVCPENFETLANWMIKNNLEPVKANFKLAFDILSKAGPEGSSILSERPAPVAVAPAPATIVEAPAPVAQPRRPASSGLTRDQSSDTGPAPKKGYSQEEIDKMSSADYKRLVLDPEFRAKRVAQRA